jgi:tetrahydromethanopterin S-methyltransferase subunit G
MLDFAKGLDAMDPNAGGPQTVEQKLDALSVSVDKRFDSVDQRFHAVDKRFDAVDKQFETVTVAIVEQRQYTEFAFGRVETRLDRIERKLDQFIDTQTKTNELVERRLTRFESR